MCQGLHRGQRTDTLWDLFLFYHHMDPEMALSQAPLPFGLSRWLIQFSLTEDLTSQPRLTLNSEISSSSLWRVSITGVHRHLASLHLAFLVQNRDLIKTEAQGHTCSVVALVTLQRSSQAPRPCNHLLYMCPAEDTSEDTTLCGDFGIVVPTMLSFPHPVHVSVTQASCGDQKHL